MDRLEIIENLKSIIKPYAENTEALANINEDTDLMKDLQINSANLVDVVLDIEEQFGIEIDNESMTNMLTVKATVQVIEEKLNANAG